MDNEELIQGLGSSVPSLDLNHLISHHGLDRWPSTVNRSTGPNSVSQSSDVIYTQTIPGGATSLTVDIGQLAQTTTTVVPPQVPAIEVVIEQRMVRFRYDSELNNRNFGKEVLAKIVVEGFIGRVKVRIHAVDDKKFKAHPFCLIGDKCIDGIYIEEHEITAEKKECICKATPRIPKQKDYEKELKLRKAVMKDASRFPYITEDMAKDDYWTINKSIKESKEIILMVEVFFFNENNEIVPYLYKYSEPINNAKDGKKFEIHAISPTASSVLGSSTDPHYIILTADSYCPNESDVVVKFCDDDIWTEETQPKVIRNALEFNFPGYCNTLSVEKDIYVYVYDKKKKLKTSRAKLTLRPTDGDIIEHKRKKALTTFTLPDYLENIKTEERPSCSTSGQRKIHHLKKRGSAGNGSASSPLDLAKLEENGLLSLNIQSPMNQNEQNSSLSQHGSNSSFSDFNGSTALLNVAVQGSSTSLNTTVSNTIPAILIPSGFKDTQNRTTIFGSQEPIGQTMVQQPGMMNSMAISQNDILLSQSSIYSHGSNQASNTQSTSDNTLSSSNIEDLAQQITNSLGNSQLQELLRQLGINPELVQSAANQTQQNQYGSNVYDPHDIRLEDLVDDLSQNDIEVDSAEISSSSEPKDTCVKCENESKHKDPEKDSASDKKSKSDKNTSNSIKTESVKNDIKPVIQSSVVTSNVDSDIEEG